MKHLPSWVVNTLREKRGYVSTWLKAIQINSHEFSNGYETVIFQWAGAIPQQMMRVHGSKYSDRALMCCAECGRTITALRKANLDYVLRACGAHSCVALLCSYCGPAHKSMHELAGDRVWDWWSRASAKERHEHERRMKDL